MQPTDLRVALFSGNYNYVRDGANQALNKLVAHLLSRGVKVRVYSPTTNTPAFPPAGDLISVPSFSIPGRAEYKLSAGLPARIRADLQAFSPDIVHVSAPDLLGHRALTWAHRHNIATLASMHTRFETYPAYYRMGFLVPWLIRGLTRFYNRADQIVVPAPSSGELLRSWGVSKPISIWSRGIDHDRFKPERRSLEWRRALTISDDDVAVGFLGRLVLEKGLDIFADVITELQRRGVPHRVLIIGDGPAREWFANRVPDAVFAGFQSGDALGRAVASMDVFFNPSVTETFGNVTVEAMAAGVPVVAARANGAVDIVQPGVTGFLVPPRDIGAYADAIQRLVEDNDLRRSAGQAGHIAAIPYEWEPVNEVVLQAYFDLLAKRGC